MIAGLISHWSELSKQALQTLLHEPESVTSADEARSRLIEFGATVLESAWVDLDLAVRLWARTNDQARQTTRRVDRRRLRDLTTAASWAGMSPDDQAGWVASFDRALHGAAAMEGHRLNSKKARETATELVDRLLLS